MCTEGSEDFTLCDGVRKQFSTIKNAVSKVKELQLPGKVLIFGFEDRKCILSWVYDHLARVIIENVDASAVGSRVVLYLDLVGRIEGKVSWISSTEIDVDITAPSAKWLRLQQQFALLAAMAPDDRENLRGYRRIKLDSPDTLLVLADGRATTAFVSDASRSGAAVQSRMLPETGNIVTLGSTRGRVVRLLNEGFAVQFLRLLPLERFGPTYTL